MVQRLKTITYKKVELTHNEPVLLLILTLFNQHLLSRKAYLRLKFDI